MQVWIVPVTPFQQNCSILRCEATGKGAVVDPGGDLERIEEVLREHDVQVEKILLTHGHVDHASAATELARRLQVPIEGPGREDLFWLESLPMQASTYGLGPAEVVAPDRWLEQGDTVSFGEVTLEVLHTPGHTPGHVVFFEPESRLVIVGDYDTMIRSIQERLLTLGDDVRFLTGHGPGTTLGEERRTNPFLLNPAAYRGMM